MNDEDDKAMPIFSLKRLPVKEQFAVFEIQGFTIALSFASVVAREPWSGSGQRPTTGNPATGYTSHSGKLVPVYDISAALQLPPGEIGSEEVAIIVTSQGYVGIQVDRFLGSQETSADIRQLTPEEILDFIIKSSPVAVNPHQE